MFMLSKSRAEGNLFPSGAARTTLGNSRHAASLDSPLADGLQGRTDLSDLHPRIRPRRRCTTGPTPRKGRDQFVSAGEQIPYCDRDPASGGLDLMPDLPDVLRHQTHSLSAVALVDSGGVDQRTPRVPANNRYFKLLMVLRQSNPRSLIAVASRSSSLLAAEPRDLGKLPSIDVPGKRHEAAGADS